MKLAPSTTLPHTLEPVVCPQCRGPLSVQSAGTRAGMDAAQVARCECCAREFSAYSGTIDFVNPGERETVERAHYNTQYRKWNAHHAAAAFDPDEWTQRWHDPHWPECQALLEHLGDLRGKLVLCLGNGSSIKELYFLTRGARLICTDLSIEGVMAARSRYDLSAFDGNIAFYAVSAYAIPLPDASVDILYGFEFVHHLPEIPSFFAEALRVLKPGGRCVFFDHAYSPL